MLRHPIKLNIYNLRTIFIQKINKLGKLVISYEKTVFEREIW